VAIIGILTIALQSCNDNGSGGFPPEPTINLYSQPLDVNQEVVQGKWKVIYFAHCIPIIPFRYNNTFVYITKNSIFTIKDTDDFICPLLLDFVSYSWEKRKLYDSDGIMRSVMTYNDSIGPFGHKYENEYGWVFSEIRNDTLYGETVGGSNIGKYGEELEDINIHKMGSFKLLRIKGENE